MSVVIKKNYNEATRLVIKKELLIVEKYNKHKPVQTSIFVCKVDTTEDHPEKHDVYIPIAFYTERLYHLLNGSANSDPSAGASAGAILQYPNENNMKLRLDDLQENIKLRSYQEKVYHESFNLLQKTRYILAALHTGFGKTKLAIKMACNLKHYILCVTNIKILKEQWVEAFNSSSNYVAFVYTSGK